MLTLPLAKLKAPPIKSNKIKNIDHPFVDLRFQFQYTAGLYFKQLIISFAYPKQLKGFQYYVHSNMLITL
jgi:hypothetical protein